MTLAESSVYRILDANCNRAGEGLRTIEDFLRFASNDVELSKALKELRHDFAAAIQLLDRGQLLSNRDSIRDVGTLIATNAEQSRVDPSHVVLAAVNRVQQAFRSLEEFGKLVSITFAERIESLRYQAYELFRRIELQLITEHQSRGFDSARLYVLINCRLSLREFIARAVSISNAGVDLLQIRDKDRTTAELIRYSDELKKAVDPTKTRIIVNDRADIAASVGLGVHLGQDDLDPATARRIVGPSLPIGISTHDIEQARQAESIGADYIGCGPTFPSTTKDFDVFSGVDFLSSVAAEIRTPAFAIGGISLERLDEVLATGIHRVAVSHAIWNAHQPEKAAAEFSSRLKTASALSSSTASA